MKLLLLLKKIFINKFIALLLCVHSFFLFSYVLYEYGDDIVLAILLFIFPVFVYLFLKYFIKNINIWLKIFILILVLGSWIFAGFILIEEGAPNRIFHWLFFIHLLLFPLAFLEAYFNKKHLNLNISKTKIFITSLILFLIIFVVRIIQVGGPHNMYERIFVSSNFLIYNNFHISPIGRCNNPGGHYDDFDNYWGKSLKYANDHIWDYFLKKEIREEYDVGSYIKGIINKFIKNDTEQIAISYLYHTGNNKYLVKNKCKALQVVMKAAHNNNKEAMALLGLQYYQFFINAYGSDFNF